MLVADRKALAEIPPLKRRELYQRLTDEVRQRIVALQRGEISNDRLGEGVG
jgi:hypothetical protein